MSVDSLNASTEKREDGTAVLTPVLIVSEAEHPLTHRYLMESFTTLQNLKNDWDKRGSLAPTPERVDEAREVLALFQASALARGLRWHDPHIGCNERGEITLEWWWHNRSLTVFVAGESAVRYLTAWGANIESDMKDGELNRISDFVRVARWLYEGVETT